MILFSLMSLSTTKYLVIEERGEGVLLLQSSLMDGLPAGECIEPIVVSNDLLVICTNVTRFHCDVLTEEL